MVTARPGGRSERVRRTVLDAALAQLLDVGYHGLTVRDVARAAAVAETTVYRRWPTTQDLAAAALGHLASAQNPTPDTGGLDTDLRALLGQILDLLRRPEVERILRTAAALDERNGAARAQFWSRRFTDSALIVRRAIERGELPADTDPDELIEFLVAPAYFRLLLTGRPVDEALLERSVRNTVAAYAVGRQKP